MHTRLQMTNKVSFHHICLPTQIATVAFDTDVELHVRVEMCSLVEALVADLALKGAMSAADHHMHVKLASVEEDFGAYGTLVSLL